MRLEAVKPFRKETILCVLSVILMNMSSSAAICNIILYHIRVQISTLSPDEFELSGNELHNFCKIRMQQEKVLKII